MCVSVYVGERELLYTLSDSTVKTWSVYLTTQTNICFVFFFIIISSIHKTNAQTFPHAECSLFLTPQPLLFVKVDTVRLFLSSSLVPSVVTFPPCSWLYYSWHRTVESRQGFKSATREKYKTKLTNSIHAKLFNGQRTETFSKTWNLKGRNPLPQHTTLKL